MKPRLFRHFTRKHLYAFLGFYLVFAGFTFLILTRQSESDWQNSWNLAATAGAISGPFTGAIARQFQSCCLEFSVRLLPYCVLSLLGGILFQFVPLKPKRYERGIRLMVWCLGLFGWFFGGIISFGHALG